MSTKQKAQDNNNILQCVLGPYQNYN